MTKSEIYRLVLFPKSAEYIPPTWQEISAGIKELGFIGSEIQNQSFNYYVGENFLKLITFLGCSPSIQLAPEDRDDNKFCSIALSPLYEEVHYRSHAGITTARCPKCRKKLVNFSAFIQQWQLSLKNIQILCDHCEQEFLIYSTNWRHNAAFARCFVDILHIYPQEAIPSDELMSTLESLTGVEWDYFFTDN